VAVIISTLNIKGGVGKTTVTMNLAHALAKEKQEICMIDLDLQSNLTDMAVKDLDKIQATIFDLLCDDDRVLSQTLYDSVIPGVDIVPADLRLVSIDKQLDSLDPDALLRLRERIDPQAKAKYDYILIDCRPDVDILTMNALLASDYFLIPVVPDRHSIAGIKITHQYVQLARKRNKGLQELGILINQFDRRSNLQKTIQQQLEKYAGDRLMDTIIGVNQGLSNAAAKRKTVFQFDRRQAGCQYFRELASEVLSKTNVLVGDVVNA
jgi:chromosome partitioning protein